ncbi:MAG: hypothetical protein HYZ53_01180 [Planctomycetes bacterium]|nr:hypothetical protein [Planctomycetota bacterium]
MLDRRRAFRASRIPPARPVRLAGVPAGLSAWRVPTMDAPPATAPFEGALELTPTPVVPAGR